MSVSAATAVLTHVVSRAPEHERPALAQPGQVDFHQFVVTLRRTLLTYAGEDDLLRPSVLAEVDGGAEERQRRRYGIVKLVIAAEAQRP